MIRAYLSPCPYSTDQLPRPSLVAMPGPVVAPGTIISLRCAGRIPGMSFALYRADVASPLQYIDSVQPWADFLLHGMNASGTYYCYYHTPSTPYVLSERSQPLVISSEGKISASRPSDPGDQGTSSPFNLETTPSVCRKHRRDSGIPDQYPSPFFGSQVLAPWTIPRETSCVWGWQDWSSSAWAS